MRVTKCLGIFISILFFYSTNAQVVYSPVTTSAVESDNVYYFNFEEALKNRKVPSGSIPFRIDSLTLFIEDSIRFHNNRQSYISDNPHVCQNRYLKFGVVDIYARPIIDFEYEFIQPKYNDSFLVVKKTCYGAINNLGKIMVPFKYAYAKQFDDNFYQYNYFEKEKFIDVYNNTGKLVFTIKAIKLSKVGAGYYAIINENYRFEKLIDSTGKEILNASEFSNIRWVRDGYICYYKNGKAGIINLNKQAILPCVYSNISSTNMKQFIVYDNAISGIVNNKNEYVIPLTKTYFVNFGNFYIASAYTSDKKLLVNKEGKLLTKSTFYIKDIQSNTENVFGKKQEDKILIVTEVSSKLQGVYNADGRQIIAPHYFRINYDAESELLVGSKIDLLDSSKVVFDLLNYEGKLISKDSPNTISFIPNNKDVLVITNNQKKSGFTNIKAKKSTSLAIYEWVSHKSKLTNGFFTANKNGLYALFSPDGKKLTSAIYSDLKNARLKISNKIWRQNFLFRIQR